MNERQTILSQATFESIPRHVFERAVGEVTRFSTILVLDGKLAGSGTFIKCGDLYGILTAHHVVHNPKDPARRFTFTGTQKLALLIDTRAHLFEIDVCACRCVDIGTPVAEETGPDLSVILLPAPRLGTLKAKKDFYNISASTDQKCQKAVSDHGFFIFNGSPACMSNDMRTPGGTGRNLFVPVVGACSKIVKRYNSGPFDFVELNVSYHTQSEAVESFAGMSGGGLWRIPLMKHLSESIDKVTFNEVVLAGVGFYQTAIECDTRSIRCHGGRSVFTETVRALLAA